MTRGNHTYHTLTIAIVGSIIAHVALVATIWPSAPNIVLRPTVRYDATLTDLAAANAGTPSLGTPTTNFSARLPRAQRNSAPARSQATFSAPEGTIAIAEPEGLSAQTDKLVSDAIAKLSDSLSDSASQDSTRAAGLQSTVASDEKPSAAPGSAPHDRIGPKKSAHPEWPEKLSIEYKLTSSITDGITTYAWKRDRNRYEIESNLQATGFLASAFLGVIRQLSSGEITETGLRPQQFSMQRGEADAEIAEFQRDKALLAFKKRSDTRVSPLAAETQDMQSFLFQMAYDLPAKSTEGDRIDVLVTNARKVYRYQFKNLGVERLQLPMGETDTVHLLSVAANPEDSYEMWLAPAYFYLPVKLKFYIGKFPVEQNATRIGSSSATAQSRSAP